MPCKVQNGRQQRNSSILISHLQALRLGNLQNYNFPNLCKIAKARRAAATTNNECLEMCALAMLSNPNCSFGQWKFTKFAQAHIPGVRFRAKQPLGRGLCYRGGELEGFGQFPKPQDAEVTADGIVVSPSCHEVATGSRLEHSAAAHG